MSATFSIAAEPERDLLRITMGGFFTPEAIAAFLEARDRAHAQLRCARNRHLTLTDVRELKIQPQEAVMAFQEMLADPAYRSRRLAFIVAPTLARGQVARATAGRGDARLFDDPAAAEAWLFAAEDEQAAPRSAAG